MKPECRETCLQRGFARSIVTSEGGSPLTPVGGIVMPIKFKCPCGKAYQVADAHAGKAVKCPQCGQALTIPISRSAEASQLNSGADRAGGLCPSSWPKARADIRNSGCVFCHPLPPPVKRWEYKGRGSFITEPLIAPDDTIYVVCGGVGLCAFGSDGTEKWVFRTRWPIGPTPAIGRDRSVYWASWDGRAYAINTDGTKRWDGPTSAKPASDVTIGDNGTVYFGSGVVLGGAFLAIDPSGELKWSRKGGLLGAFAVGAAIGGDGVIYLGCCDKRLYALSPDGSLKWKLKTRGLSCNPVLGLDDTVYFGTHDKALHAVTRNGAHAWQIPTDKIVSGLGVGRDNSLYVTFEHGGACHIDNGGTVKWSYRAECEELSMPAVGGDGSLYVACSDGKLRAVDPDGQPRWAFDLGEAGRFRLSISFDGDIYVATSGKRLLALGT